VISSASSEFISTDLPKASKELDPEFNRIVQAERSEDPNDEEPYRFGIGIWFLWIVRFQALVSLESISGVSYCNPSPTPVSQTKVCIPTAFLNFRRWQTKPENHC